MKTSKHILYKIGTALLAAALLLAIVFIVRQSGMPDPTGMAAESQQQEEAPVMEMTETDRVKRAAGGSAE